MQVSVAVELDGSLAISDCVMVPLAGDKVVGSGGCLLASYEEEHLLAGIALEQQGLFRVAYAVAIAHRPTAIHPPLNGKVGLVSLERYSCGGNGSSIA